MLKVDIIALVFSSILHAISWNICKSIQKGSEKAQNEMPQGSEACGTSISSGSSSH